MFLESSSGRRAKAEAMNGERRIKMNEKNELNEQQLEKVNGGTHLSSGEVKAMVPGRSLVWENIFGKDLAEVEFISYTDPGPFKLLECEVKITKIYSSEGYIEMSGQDEAGRTVFTRYRVGDICKLPRDLLDLSERA